MLFITQPHCIQLQLYSSTVCMNCLTLILFMQHAITKSILNTEIILSSYIKIILSIMLALCLMPLGTRLLCPKLCQHNRLVPSPLSTIMPIDQSISYQEWNDQTNSIVTVTYMNILEKSINEIHTGLINHHLWASCLNVALTNSCVICRYTIQLVASRSYTG